MQHQLDLFNMQEPSKKPRKKRITKKDIEAFRDKLITAPRYMKEATWMPTQTAAYYKAKEECRWEDCLIY